MSKTKEEIETPLQVKRQMIEVAKEYASHKNGGVTMNNPDKYKYFRDGQDSGYSLASQQTSELKGVLSKIKNLALSRSQTLTAISGDEILKLIEDKVNL